MAHTWRASLPCQTGFAAQAAAAAVRRSSCGSAMQLHRARFVEWTPAAVAAVAATADGCAVAVARDDGAIELYDVASDWRCAVRVPGCAGASITTLVWAERAAGARGGGGAAAAAAPPRLFSAGLSGEIVEWDLQALRPLAATDSTGGPVWHMSARAPGDSGAPQCLAVACDDGCLRLFEPADKGVAYVRSFPRIDARLLCTAWHPNRSTLVVGSSDGCLRCWDSRTTTELLRITLAHGAGPQAAPCVWSVLVLADGTLVSGDSEGYTSFWDGEHGTMRQSFKAHEADVLALACTPAGDAVFAAGVDSKVALLARVAPAGEEPAPDAYGSEPLALMSSWAVAGYKRAHTHDVRALVVAPFPPAAADVHDAEGGPLPHPGSVLLSAGTDAQLLAYAAENFLGEHPVRVVRLPPSPAQSLTTQPAAAVLSGRPLLLCTHATWVDVWQLGTAADRSADASPLGNGSALELAAAPAHLARIHVRTKRHLLCSAIAADGSFVAASDALAPHVFALSAAAGKKVRVSKRVLATAVPAAQHLAFTADCTHLVLAALAGPVHLVSLETGETTHVFRSHLTFDGIRAPRRTDCIALPPVTRMCVSLDRQWLAVAVAADATGPFSSAARSSCVCVYSLEAQRTHAMLPLPSDGTSGSPVVALTFSPACDTLVVATASKDIQLFDVESGKSSWRASVPGPLLPERLRLLPGHMCALSVDPSRGLSAVLAHTQHAMCHLDLTRPLSADVGTAPHKRRRMNLMPPRAAAPAASDANGRVIPLEHPCLFAGHIHAAAALLVERPWDSILRSLPPPLLRHRFGV